MGCRGCQRLVHDASDGAGAAPALGAATEAMINFTGGTRATFAGRKRAAHVVVREHVTRTDDHGTTARRQLVRSVTIFTAASLAMQRKTSVYRHSKLGCGHDAWVTGGKAAGPIRPRPTLPRHRHPAGAAAAAAG